MYRQQNMVWLISRSQRKPFRKIGSRYTKKQYSSKGNEVVNNVEVIGHLLCHLTNLRFMKGLIADYLSAWIENQSRTPNERCAFQSSFLPVIKDRLSELIETNTRKRKLWFCPTTENKKVKLLLTNQQNYSFCYHILMCKRDWFSWSSHRICSKNKKTNKQIKLLQKL